MSRHHTFPRCTREAPYMGRYRPTHALIATTDRILTVFSWQTGSVEVRAGPWLHGVFSDSVAVPASPPLVAGRAAPAARRSRRRGVKADSICDDECCGG